MSSLVDRAFNTTPREQFLLPENKAEAALDVPIPIGHGQTNSQPFTVRLMLEWLSAQPGEKILDIGSGSGWTSALLANIVGANGTIYAVERIPELVAFGKDNCKKLQLKNVRFFQSGAVIGLPEHAPFDRILVSADAESLPTELVNQLKPGGRIVIPIQGDMQVVDKNSDNTLSMQTYPGFRFVPLVD